MKSGWTMTDPDVHVRFYIADQRPKFRLAVTGLSALCETGRYETDVVAAFHQAERALEDGMFLPPRLEILSPVPVQSNIANLSYVEILIRAFIFSRSIP